MRHAPPHAAVISTPSLASLTCAHLLHQAGWQVVLPPAAMPSLQGAILLRPDTARLLCTLWGDANASLLAGAHPLRRRWVRWGEAPAAAVEAPGLVVELAPLLARLAARLSPGIEMGVAADMAADMAAYPPGSGASAAPAAGAWRLAARGSEAAGLGALRRYGARQAWISQVRLAPSAAADMALVEQNGTSWAMVMPCGGGRAMLHQVALPPAATPGIPPALPGRIAQDVAGIEDTQGPFDAMPRLRMPAAGAGVIALGEAAIAVDPLCGDGAGHALRSAWAACEALCQAARAPDAQAQAWASYQHGLQAAMTRHLQACAQYYARSTPAWPEGMTDAA